MTASPGRDEMALYRAHVLVQTVLGLIVAVVLVVLRPAPEWAFAGVAVLGCSSGVLAYLRLRAAPPPP